MYACCRITWCLNARTYWCWQENSRESAAGPTSDQKPLVAAAVDHSPSSSGSGDVVRSAVSDCTLHFYFSTQSVHGARGIMFLHCSPICVCMQYTSINPPVWWYMEIHEVSSNHWARWLKWLNSDPSYVHAMCPKNLSRFSWEQTGGQPIISLIAAMVTCLVCWIWRMSKESRHLVRLFVIDCIFSTRTT